MITKAKERPILFSGPMVRTILDGKKTQTRRIVKSKGQHFHKANHAVNRMTRTGQYSFIPNDVWEFGVRRPMPDGTPSSHFAMCDLVRCPYGMTDEQLWVRETWHPSNHVHFGEKADYLADTPDARGEGFWKWNPSIFMPRWASRITLKIVSVRVERLQAISEADAIAEGIESYDDDGVTYYGPLNKGHACPKQEYRRLWDSINGKGSWESNCWVWAIDFRRIKPESP